MRKLYLEELFASLDAEFQAGSFTEEWADNSFCLQESVAQRNKQDEGRVMRGDDSEEDDDERDATYVPEDGGDNGEDGDSRDGEALWTNA